MEKLQDSKIVNLNAGHRKRMRSKFIMSSSQSSFQDYEILEMLLFSIYPRRDTKDIAKKLLKEYGSLKKFYLQDLETLASDTKLSESLKFQVMLLKELFIRLTVNSEEDDKMHVFRNWDAVLKYLRLNIGDREREFFKTLYLNRGNALIGTQLFDSGTVNKVAVYPREIVKGAIKHNASAVIVAHNHPSGSAQPSNQDMKITRLIKSALSTVDIVLHDHIIIAGEKYYSFKDDGVL